MLTKVLTESGSCWQCGSCEYNTKKKSNLVDHIEAKHIEGGYFICKLCNHPASTKRGLRNHHYGRHKEIPFNVQNVWITHIILELILSCIIILGLSSKINIILSLLFALEYMDSVVSSKIFKSPEGVFHCTDCDYSSRWENCLKIHIESKHVRTGGFSCSLCEKVCPTRNALKVHCQRRHKPDLPTQVYHA